MPLERASQELRKTAQSMNPNSKAEAEAEASMTEATLKAQNSNGFTNGSSPKGPKPTRSLRSLALRGSVWTLGGYGASQALRLVSSMILTRLLMPEAFGLSALVGVFLVGLAMFSDLGISPAIVRDPRGEDPRFLNTAWTMQILRGFFLWIGSVVIAVPLAILYDEPLLTWMLPVAGVTAILQGFEATAIHLCARRIDLTVPTIIMIVQPVVNLVVAASVAISYPGAGAWALIAGSIVSTLVQTVLGHVLLPGPGNRLEWDRVAVRSLLSFGRWIFLGSLLTFLAMQSDRLVLGQLASMETLGIYAIGATLALIPAEISQRLTISIFYPIATRSQSPSRMDHARIRRARLALLSFSGLICAGFMGAGPALIEVLYDNRYSAAAGTVALLAAGAWIRGVAATYFAIVLARGIPYYQAVGMALKIAIFLILAWPMYQSFGMIGIAGLMALGELGPLVTCALGAARSRMSSLRIDLLLTAFMLLGAGLLHWVIDWSRTIFGSSLLGLTVVGLVVVLLMIIMALGAYFQREKVVAVVSRLGLGKRLTTLQG